MVPGPRRKGRLVSLVGEERFVRWSFLKKYAEVTMLADNVAYSWTCGKSDESDHQHVIESLWVWHDCTQEIADPNRQMIRADDYQGWSPTGVGAHDLISADPLHIEASVYWPACCGMHGWIRDGQWIDAG